VDGAAVDGAAVADARALLERLALVGEPPETPLSTGAAYACAAVGGWVGPAEAAHRLAATTVHVWAEDAGEGDGPDDAGPGGLARTLRRSGLSVALLSGPAAVADLDPARSVVVVAADEAEPLRRMRAANRACLAAGVPWLPIGAYDGARLPVGPLCLPGQTACFGCLEQRLAANVAYAGLFPAVAAAPAAPTPPALRDWAHALAGLVLLHWIGLREATLPGRLFTLVPAEIAVRSAPVLRVPRCPVCTAPEYRPAAAPWGPDRDH
jgi:bacteriocin biosynthesis cyclodehydratase domain-containing protein